MSAVHSSRVNDTDPSPYDQIFILSQAVINDAFKKMFPDKVEFHRLDMEATETYKKYGYTHMKGQWIQAPSYVLAPWVTIHVEERSPKYKILFHLPFDSGLIHLRTSAPGEVEKFRTLQLKKWVLVFKTNISSKLLGKDDPRYNAYKTPFFSSSPGFRDTVFSLKRLYLDTSDVGAGAGLDASLSSYGDETLDDKTRYNLKLFANEWLNNYDDRGLNVIGYSLTQDNSTPQQRSQVGTFVPSIIDYDTYPWIDPEYPTVETDGLTENALAILTYNTNNRRGYAPPGLKYSGVFTKGGAAFCMNRDLFWGQFVLSNLQEINKMTEILPLWPRQRIFEINFSMGKNNQHKSARDPYFAWKQHTRNGQTYWAWKGAVHKAATQWAQGRARYAHNTSSSTELTFSRGGQDLQVKGTIVFNAEAKLTSPPPWSHGVHSQTEWQLQFRIQTASNGGLQIVPVGNPTVHVKQLKNSNPINPKNKEFYDKVLRKMQNSINNYLKGALKKISAQLAAHLAELHKLVLPARGVFSFGKPEFNKRGDLLVDLKYLGPIGPFTKPTGHFVTDAPEDDIAAQFEHLAGQHPEDESQFDSGDDQGEGSEHYIDLHGIGERHYGELEFPGPGPGPLADVDWDKVEHTELPPWNEDDDDEKKPDERPPPDEEANSYIPPPLSELDG